MEKEIKIKTTDSKYIYGVLRIPRNSLRLNGKPLVVFVHGLTGHKNEHHFFNGARFFEKRGWPTFRFDLYGDEKRSRHLQNCTLETHAKDLDTVIDYFINKGAKKIFVAGHSYGGLTILASKNKKYDAITLWDSSYEPFGFFKHAKRVMLKESAVYIEDWGIQFVLGEEMIKEAKKLTGKKCVNLIKSVHAPVNIIVAGKGGLIKGGKKYFKAANVPKEFTVIKNATHCFDEDGAEEKLFQETYNWFSKFK